MNIAILGTGTVGETIATALAKGGHHVCMGSRTPGNEKAAAWVKSAGEHASQSDFDDAARFGRIVFLCVNGEHALDVAKRVNPASVQDKIIIDVTNPLDFARGLPPRILEGFREVSLGEQIQEALPAAHVVKALNTMNTKLMVDAGAVGDGDHQVLICGNNKDAKKIVAQFLVDNFYWKESGIIDLGSIQQARVTEAYVPLWVSLMQVLGTPMFNLKIVK